MRIIDQIKAKEVFTPTERTIAEYLEKNSKEAVNLSLDELSSRLYVSKSSIIRFCKKLGFKGHKELSVQLAKELNTFTFDDKVLNPSLPYEPGDDRRTIADKTYTLNLGALQDTYQDLNLDQIYGIARVIHDLGKVYIYSAEESYLNAKWLEVALREVGIQARLVSIPGSNVHQALRQEEGSAALFILYEERQEGLVRPAQVLKEKKIPVYLITGPKKGPLAKYATETVSVGFYESYPKVYPIGSATAVKLVTDILFADIFNMDYQRNMNKIQKEDSDRKRLNSSSTNKGMAE